MDIVQSGRIVMAHPVKSRLSQETLAIIGVGVALAALNIASTAGLRGEIQAARDEARAERQAIRVEASAERQAMRVEASAERQAMRVEASADREAMHVRHETFRNQILRLTEQQGVLRARLDGVSDQPAPGR